MSKKMSKTVHAGITREEADKALAEYASAHAKHESLMAKKGFYYQLYQSQFDSVS